jgi:hypothetical protein
MDDTVTEDQCLICRLWPPADRVALRAQRFSTDYIEIPIKGVCERCQMEFWIAITGCEPTTKH